MSKAHRRLDRRRWGLLRRTVLDEERWTCRKCGRYANEVDHVVALERGGDPYARENLQALCGGGGGCHAEKTRKENRRRSLTAPEREWRDHVQRVYGG